MKAYLTLRPHGRSMMTRLVPTVAEVGRNGFDDAYVTPGDPFLVADICRWATGALLPEVELEPLAPVEVDVHLLSPAHAAASAQRLVDSVSAPMREAIAAALISHEARRLSE